MNEASHVLEEIRRTELEGARRVERARAQSEAIVDEARSRARRIVEEAREQGREDARQRLERAIAEAQDTAAQIRESGVIEASRLSNSTARSMDSVIEEMVRVVLAPPSEPGR